MKIVWITADTFRRDHLGCYGNERIRTPALDSLASAGVRFDRHYAGAFPTMPTRADHFSGRWTMSFMGWGPLGPDFSTLAQLLSTAGIHTAAVVDTPFYLRHGMNYDRGFETFYQVLGQEGSNTRSVEQLHHEARDVRALWSSETDRNAPRTMMQAMQWLELHHEDDFFLYVDTWDPHEPWDAPPYYTEQYWPGFDGEVIEPVYARWQDADGMTETRLRKAHATYMGEISMVDTWIGHLLDKMRILGIDEETTVIFTSDHGFYFGEHGGFFGKMCLARKPDGDLWRRGEPGATWARSPLYQELVSIPLLLKVPGLGHGTFSGLTSAVDVMPTVLELAGVEAPAWVEGRSLLTSLDAGAGREFTVSTIPFANPGEKVDSVDNAKRMLETYTISTVTNDAWALLYSPDPGMSELFNLETDVRQSTNVIESHPEVARELHNVFIRFLNETNVPDYLRAPRLRAPI